MVKEYKDWLFVYVELNGEDFRIKKVQGLTDNFILEYSEWLAEVKVYLPPGSWQIIGKGDELGESDWEDIAEIAVHMENFEQLINDGWWNYEKEGTTLETAAESGLSLLRSLEMEPGTTLILKKQN